jgi:outer membrane protein assembly factor BamB
MKLQSSSDSMRMFLRCVTLVLTFGVAALAQMGGMMGPNNPGNPMGPGQNNGMHQGQGMGQGMGTAVMNAMNMGMGGREMMDGPAVGPDGTAYVVRTIPQPSTNSNSPTQLRQELMAVNARDGSTRWRLEIAGGMVSDPALAKDGRIFLTVSEFSMETQTGSGMMNPGSGAGKARLLVIASDSFSARIATTVEVESDVLSTPRVAPDETGNYVIYVTGFERGARNGNNSSGNDSMAAGEKYLYAFNPDGRQRFRLKLAEARVGMPAN